jgi:phosphoglycolate phosphatase
MTEPGHPFRLILFDVDGTLVDSQEGIVSAMAAAFAEVGLAAPAPQATRRVVGLSLDRAVGRLLPEGEADPRLDRAVAAYKQAYQAHRRRPDFHEPLFEGALQALAALDHPQVCLGVATGKSRRGLDAVLAHHGLTGRFVTLQTADAGPGKPDPHMLHAAMADVGAEPAETVLIGDTVYDVEMAGRAGVTPIGVAWGYHPPEELQAAGAHAVVPHFDALPPALAQITRTAA